MSKYKPFCFVLIICIRIPKSVTCKSQHRFIKLPNVQLVSTNIYIIYGQ